MWSNIVDRKFLSTLNVHPTTPTMAIHNVTPTTISNVLIELEPSVLEPNVHEPNMDEDVEKHGNWLNMDEIQPPVSYIYPSPDDVPFLCYRYQINNP